MSLSLCDIEADSWLDDLDPEDRQFIRQVEETPMCEVTPEDRERFEVLRYGETGVEIVPPPVRARYQELGEAA